jgi:hypothetical protein
MIKATIEDDRDVGITAPTFNKIPRERRKSQGSIDIPHASFALSDIIQRTGPFERYRQRQTSMDSMDQSMYWNLLPCVPEVHHQEFLPYTPDSADTSCDNNVSDVSLFPSQPAPLVCPRYRIPDESPVRLDLIAVD